MAIDNATSVKLMVPETGQISTQAKASDIIFLDGIDLQTKFNNMTLVNPVSLTGVNAVSPKVEVITNTDTEYRIRIKSINGTIISPNLKGSDSNAITQEIRDMLSELEERVENLSSLEDVATRITQISSSLDEINAKVFSLEEDVDRLKTGMEDRYTKDEIGNMISSCVTGIDISGDGLVVTRHDGTESDAVPLWYSLSDADINSIF